MVGSHRPPAELKLLTALRGLAAWWVVLYHIRAAMPWAGAEIQHALSFGYLGVDFFFLLSGFVIWISAQRDFMTDGWHAYGPFLWRRFARIAPLYFFMLAGAVILALGMEALGKPNPGLFVWRDLPFHIFMVQSWGIIDPLHWNIPAWSISTELAAYLLFPLLAVPVRAVHNRVGVLAGLFVLLCAGLYFFFASQQHPTLGNDIEHTALVRCVLLFAAGMCVAQIWAHIEGRDILIAGGGAVLVLLASVALISGWGTQIMLVPFIFGVALLVLAIIDRRFPGVTPRWLHYLGDISYSTYLVHYLAWFLFKLLFVQDAHDASPLIVGAYLIAVLCASVLLYRVVERPAQRWLRARAPVNRTAAKMMRS